MTPSRLEELVVRSAKWMMGRENFTKIWWAPPVLTSENQSDQTNPQLALSDAEEVFDVLKQRNLLISKALSVQTENGSQLISVYTINQELKSEWLDLTNKVGFLDLVLKPWAKKIWGGYHPAILGFIYAVILAFFVRIIENWADKLCGAVK